MKNLKEKKNLWVKKKNFKNTLTSCNVRTLFGS